MWDTSSSGCPLRRSLHSSSSKSYKWGEYGHYIWVKELQTRIQLSILFHFLYSLIHKETLLADFQDIFAHVKQLMNDKGYFSNHDHPFEWGYMDIPPFTICSNVPKLSRANTHAMSKTKMPSHLQTFRWQYHLECPTEWNSFFKVLVEFAKHHCIFKVRLGSHVNPSEVVDWSSSSGDLKRAENMAKLSANYNTSPSNLIVFGFTNLSNTISTFSGKECLMLFFKMQDGTPSSRWRRNPHCISQYPVGGGRGTS